MPVYETTPLQFHGENNYSAWGGKLLRRCAMDPKENQTKKKVSFCRGGWPIRASRVVAANPGKNYLSFFMNCSQEAALP